MTLRMNKTHRDVGSAADLRLSTYGRVDFVVASAGIADST